MQALQVEVYLASSGSRTCLGSLGASQHLHVSNMKVLGLQVEGFLHIEELRHYSCMRSFWLLGLG